MEPQKNGNKLGYVLISSIVSVLITSFAWMLLTAGLRAEVRLNANAIEKLETNQILITDLRADIAVLKSNMSDVRASIRVIERGFSKGSLN